MLIIECERFDVIRLSSEADSTEAELKQLWPGSVPPLTPEQRELAIQLWQKIKARQQWHKLNDYALLD